MRKQHAGPRYLTLAEDLRQAISSGEFKPGDQLPSETQLCARHGVSRGTVVRAIEQLVTDGIVHRRQGAGSFVARPSLHRRAGSLLSFSQSTKGEGFSTEQKLITLQPASAEQAIQFQCNEPAVFLSRLRSIEGVACAVHRSIIPTAVASRVEALNGEDEAALKSGSFSLYEAFETAGFRVVEAHERVATRLATEEEAQLLQVDEPAAVMVVFRRSYVTGGRLIEAAEAVYLGEYYTCDMHLVAAPSIVPGAQGSNVLTTGGRLIKPQTEE